jgi:hypothetical protein
MDVRELTKSRLLEKCVNDVAGWKVMIVDNASMKVISAACKMYDIVEKGVTGEHS